MDDIFADQLRALLVAVIFVTLYAAPVVVLYVTFCLVSLPLRRRERARLFLDLLELGMNDGHTPERAIVEAARSRDPVLGWRFRMLAELLEGGRSLSQGLDLVHRLVPAEVAAMLKAGQEIGDVRRVLPACRQTLQDALSQTRGALNYLVILGFVILPVVPVIAVIMSIFVVPKFEMIARDMMPGEALPELSRFTFAFSPVFVWLQVSVMLLFQIIILCYVAGPRLRHGFGVMGGMVDRLLWLLPWRRRRVQRDFATMLALLLDAQVPEARALALAGESANNSILQQRVARAAEELASGARLTDVVRGFDRSGEFHWRLTNATESQRGFLHALRGWLQSLDAKAFQQEQAAAQTLSTALVLWNGLVIGLFVVGMFSVLTNLVHHASLW